MNIPANDFLSRTEQPQRILVGLSGGVDSSIAAHLLIQQGHQIEALFMKNWEEDDKDGSCNAAEDYSDAMSVAKHLDMKLHERNFSAEYWDNVFEECLTEFRAGRTPNPDILCNREIKFNVFLDHALELGAEKIATGHYAQISFIDGKYKLLKAVDDNKDQSYFLYALNQKQLSSTLFPLGTLKKEQVRELAKQLSLVTHNKKDSTGICFIGERNFKPFLKQYINEQPGEIRTTENELIGNHDGLMFYTMGQRKGLEIGGYKLKSGENTGDPWYVAGKNMQTNTLIVAQGHDHPMLFNKSLTAINLHWISGKPPAALSKSTPFKCMAKTRYRQADQECVIEKTEQNSCVVSFTKPQRALTPGQSIVFYQGEECLGGAIIESTEN